MADNTSATRLTIPLTMAFSVVGVLIATFGAWWVSAQEDRVAKNTQDIEKVEKAVVQLQLDVTTELVGLHKEADAQTKAMDRIVKSIEKIEDKLEKINRE